MAIVRFDPFRELAVMQDRINRMFGDAYTRRDDDVLSRGDWIPPVDIFENDKHEVVIKAEMPGLKREDIDLRVENSTLTIRGERKRESEVKDDRVPPRGADLRRLRQVVLAAVRGRHRKRPGRLQGRHPEHHSADARRGQAAADSGAGQRLTSFETRCGSAAGCRMCSGGARREGERAPARSHLRPPRFAEYP